MSTFTAGSSNSAAMTAMASAVNEHTPPAEIEFLRSVSLFSLLNADELKELQTCLHPLRVPAGEMIFKYRDPGDALYIVVDGEIDLWINDNTGHKISLAAASPTHIFGELSLFDLGTRSANATATVPTRLLALHRADLIAFLSRKPHAAINLIAVMARKLRETDYMLMKSVTRNPNTEFEQKSSTVQRLANWIAEFSGSMPFLFINAAVFFLWIVINLALVPGIAAFDPYPFGFLTMSVSLEAIFLSIFVLLAQNLQSAKERVRSDVEYEINLKAELGVSELNHKINLLHDDLVRRLEVLEKTSVGSK